MSDGFRRILDLVARREVLLSDHGYDELAADGILIKDVYEGSARVPSWRHPRRITKGRACWFCSGITMASQSMSCGASRAV
jgi:hypothetical protein